MDFKNYVACSNILGIQTNAEYIGWSFGLISHPVEAKQLDQCKIVIRFVVEDLKEQMKELDSLQKYHYWAGNQDQKKLYYQRNFLFGTKLQLMICDAFGLRPEIRVNKYYLKHIKWRFNNLHSPGYILTDLICTLLLRQAMCALHCSAFRIEDKTVLVIAPPDTGKTLTTMRAVFDYGASFISEDLAITDGLKIYACPWTSTFRYYDELSMSRLMALRMKLIKIFPFVEIMPFPGKMKTIDNYIGRERIIEVTPITHVAILARREGGIKEIDGEEALRMVYNLNRYEFFYRKSPMLTAYTYFNPEIDLEDLSAKEKKILNNLVNQSKCLLVQNRDPREFAQQIIDSIR